MNGQNHDDDNDDRGQEDGEHDGGVGQEHTAVVRVDDQLGSNGSCKGKTYG